MTVEPRRLMWVSVAVVAVALAALPSTTEAQSAATRPAPSAVPRTAGGRPDLQGMWTNATLTPLERPPALADKGSVTDPEARPLAERCLLSFGSSSRPPMLPVLYNNHYQIVHTADHVMIQVEMVHDARIIPLDGRAHPPANIRKWMGDSIGHWEGDTLVVDTTHFTDKVSFRGSSPELHVIERFTRIDAKTILYTFAVDDPATFRKQWTGEVPLRATDERFNSRAPVESFSERDTRCDDPCSFSRCG